MNKRLLVIVAGIVVLVAGVFIVSRQYPPATEENGRPSSSAENKIFAFNFKDYDGNSIPLADFKGKPLAINAWATWCIFCRQELVDFAEVQEEFGDKAVIIAINRQESREKAREYTDDLSVTEGLIFLLDPDDSFYKAIGGAFMPETVFIDRSGKITFHKRGVMAFSEIKDRMDSLVLR